MESGKQFVPENLSDINASKKFDPVEATALRLTVLQSTALPDIINFSAFSVN